MSDVDIDCGDCNCGDCDCDCGDCCSGAGDCDCCCCFPCFDSDGNTVPDDDTTWNLCIIFNLSNNRNQRYDSCLCCCCCDDHSLRTNPYANTNRNSSVDDKNKPKVAKEQTKESDDVDPTKPSVCSYCGAQLPKNNNYRHQFPNYVCPRCQEFTGSRPSFVPPRSQRFEALHREKYLGRGKESSFYAHR